MITYEPGCMGFAGMFACKGSVFPKALVWALPCSIIAGLLHRTIFQDSGVKLFMGLDSTAATVYGGFTFILGFLVVFRSQQAYNRWWEGGTLLRQLRGEWFNAFSSLMAFSNCAPEKKVEVMKFQQQLTRLFSLLHGCALSQVSHMTYNHFELINLEGFDAESLVFLQTCPDKCEIALQWIQRLIVECEATGVIKIAPPILSRVYNELGNGIVNLNNAKKIKDFLIPFPLAQIIIVMLTCHSMFTPLVCAATVNTTLWASLLTFVVIFSYWSVLYIALELEMPFGDDLNDLPLCEMAVDMNVSLQAMMQPLASKVPEYVYKPELDDLSTVTVDLDQNICLVAAPRTYGDHHAHLASPVNSTYTSYYSREEWRCARQKEERRASICATEKRSSSRNSATSFSEVEVKVVGDPKVEVTLPAVSISCSSLPDRASRAAPPAAQVKVVGDSKTPPKLEQEATSSTGLDPALFGIPDEDPAMFGIPDPPTIRVEAQPQPKDAKSKSAEQQSKSEAASGATQRKNSAAEIAQIFNSGELLFRTPLIENAVAPALASLPHLSPSHQHIC